MADTKSKLLERCKGRKDEAYVKLTVAELKDISDERPDLADFVEVRKSVEEIKKLCEGNQSGQPDPAKKNI